MNTMGRIGGMDPKKPKHPIVLILPILCILFVPLV